MTLAQLRTRVAQEVKGRGGDLMIQPTDKTRFNAALQEALDEWTSEGRYLRANQLAVTLPAAGKTLDFQASTMPKRFVTIDTIVVEGNVLLLDEWGSTGAYTAEQMVRRRRDWETETGQPLRYVFEGASSIRLNPYPDVDYDSAWTGTVLHSLLTQDADAIEVPAGHEAGLVAWCAYRFASRGRSREELGDLASEALAAIQELQGLGASRRAGRRIRGDGRRQQRTMR